MGGIEVWGISELHAIYINGFEMPDFEFDAEKQIARIWYTQLLFTWILEWIFNFVVS
eukprot:TRINITY_DN11878_c0_g1_i1.p1 TRINITY_DN11878_c0_g1~~TRINITY_DN11878_c0_g1_i1.p1  ORF type:complete len:57 (+),score=13.47 TRINITY_DN11878_c0_g1_i1:406-576(+)